MKMNVCRVMAGMSCILLLLFLTGPASVFSASPQEIPVKGMVTMVDLGAKKCIPCKMMAPILEKLEKAYAGRAAVIFLDVWEDPKPAHRFNVLGIPTQIFFDRDGKEVDRHTGFLGEEDIVRRFKDMGVE
ncbi:MAG: Thioredoxin [Syntrophaceae bacterium PtaU1.Bin231]|nr:MAG: Thioredoxin [Syntrophaceae bacterium PtaU1.Bin231]